MDKSELGKMIARYQKKYGLKQRAVHEGISSQGSFQKGDYGDRDVEFIIQETMLGRVGQTAESFEVVLGDEEYDARAMRMAIRSAVAVKDYDAVEEKVKLYRQENVDKHKLHEQFCLYYEMKLAHWRGEGKEIVGQLAECALKMTKKIDDMPHRKESLYTPMELDLLLTLILYRYGEWTDLWKCGECLRRIIEYVKVFYTIEKREEIEGKARVEQIKLIEKYEEPENLLPYIDEAIACFAGATGIERLGEVRFIKAKLLWRGYEKATNKDEQKKLCMRECMMAYCIYASLRQEDKVKEIKDFCQEELQWHITMQI